ncbi:MAG: hypothetical protein HND47_02100 [Chloroflexi bacterium]|nr:hypothetical protein [Chloroflexota bacterium]
MKIESYCLGVLLRKPDLLYRLDRGLEEFGLTALTVEDFEYTDHQLLFGVLRLAMEQDEKEHEQYVLSQIPETLSTLTNDLLAQTEKVDTLDEKLLDDLLGRFLDLRRTHAMTNVNQLRFIQEDEQQAGGANLKVYMEQTGQYIRLISAIDQAKRKLSKRQV